jgi:hypothetical protein
MYKNNLNLYSQADKTGHQEHDQLYLILDQKNIVFSVKSTNNHFIALEHFSIEDEVASWSTIEQFLTTHSTILNWSFRSISLIWNSPKFLLTKKLIKEDTLLYIDELNLVHPKLNEEELYISRINHDLVLLFNIPDVMSALFSRLFPNGSWHHYTEYILHNHQDNEVSIYFFDTFFCIKIIKAGKLQFINYFDLEEDDQNAYNILNACSNCDLDLGTAKIKIFGYFKAKHQFIHQVATYFSTGEIVEIPKEGIGAYLRLEEPNHIYATYLIF